MSRRRSRKRKSGACTVRTSGVKATGGGDGGCERVIGRRGGAELGPGGFRPEAQMTNGAAGE